MTLPEVFELRLRLKALEQEIASGGLSLFERCEKEDEVLEIKERLGEFDRHNQAGEEACINCSG